MERDYISASSFVEILVVMCDYYTPAGEPIPTNHRAKAVEIFSHPDVVEEVPWGHITVLLVLTKHLGMVLWMHTIRLFSVFTYARKNRQYVDGTAAPAKQSGGWGASASHSEIRFDSTSGLSLVNCSVTSPITLDNSNKDGTDEMEENLECIRGFLRWNALAMAVEKASPTVVNIYIA